MEKFPAGFTSALKTGSKIEIKTSSPLTFKPALYSAEPPSGKFLRSNRSVKRIFRLTERERERQRDRDRQTERQRQRQRDRDRQRQTDRDRETHRQTDRQREGRRRKKSLYSRFEGKSPKARAA